jgi:hypothetical protein
VNDLVADLNVAGAALVLVGIATGAVTFRRSERSVRTEREQLKHIMETHGKDSAGLQRAIKGLFTVESGESVMQGLVALR